MAKLSGPPTGVVKEKILDVLSRPFAFFSNLCTPLEGVRFYSIDQVPLQTITTPTRSVSI